MCFGEPEPSADLEGSEEPVHRYEPTDFPKGRPQPKGHAEVHLLPEVVEAKANRLQVPAVLQVFVQ